MTTNDVREDLKKIRYYFDRQTDMDIACQTTGQKTIKELVEKYNVALKNIAPQFLDTYVGLYVNGNTQESFADETGKSVMTVRRNNSSLIQYLAKVLSE